MLLFPLNDIISKNMSLCKAPASIEPVLRSAQEARLKRAGQELLRRCSEHAKTSLDDAFRMNLNSIAYRAMSIVRAQGPEKYYNDWLGNRERRVTTFNEFGWHAIEKLFSPDKTDWVGEEARMLAEEVVKAVSDSLLGAEAQNAAAFGEAVDMIDKHRELAAAIVRVDDMVGTSANRTKPIRKECVALHHPVSISQSGGSLLEQPVRSTLMEIDEEGLHSIWRTKEGVYVHAHLKPADGTNTFMCQNRWRFSIKTGFGKWESVSRVHSNSRACIRTILGHGARARHFKNTRKLIYGMSLPRQIAYIKCAKSLPLNSALLSFTFGKDISALLLRQFVRKKALLHG